jgi:hypothetical protein
MIYWSGKGKDGWFYKTYSDWEKETSLSEHKVRTISNKFKKIGILQTEIHKVNGNPALHYKINETNFTDSFLKFCNTTWKGDKI